MKTRGQNTQKVTFCSADFWTRALGAHFQEANAWTPWVWRQAPRTVQKISWTLFWVLGG